MDRYGPLTQKWNSVPKASIAGVRLHTYTHYSYATKYASGKTVLKWKTGLPPELANQHA